MRRLIAKMRRLVHCISAKAEEEDQEMEVEEEKYTKKHLHA